MVGVLVSVFGAIRRCEHAKVKSRRPGPIPRQLCNYEATIILSLQRKRIAFRRGSFEDSLLPNTDLVNDESIVNPTAVTSFSVAHSDRFTPGDQILLAGKTEIMLVTAVNNSTNTLTVIRNYGGSSVASVEHGDTIHIIGNAALEGDNAPIPRFTTRVRRQNFTQIFTKSVEVSGSQLAVQAIGVADELDYQKQERLRELLRDLENCVINGIAPMANPQGGTTIRRTMNGILASITTNRFVINTGEIPAGDGPEENLLTENVLNTALRTVWEQSSGTIDTIVCSGFQKRRINSFIAASQRYAQNTTTFSSMVDVYESDFGVCRVVLSRWMPPDKLLLLDSSRIDVMPLAGRSFHFKPLASTGDSEAGQIIGEYTLELRNENAHAVISGLGATTRAI